MCFRLVQVLKQANRKSKRKKAEKIFDHAGSVQQLTIQLFLRPPLRLVPRISATNEFFTMDFAFKIIFEFVFGKQPKPMVERAAGGNKDGGITVMFNSSKRETHHPGKNFKQVLSSNRAVFRNVD